MSHLISAKHTACLFLIFCGLFSAVAQKSDDGTDIPIIDMLKTLEKNFDVSFSFADSLIIDIKVSPSNGNTLDDHLHYIEQQTLIEFEKLSDRFIAVKFVPDKRISVCGNIKNRQSKNAISDAIIQSGNGFIFTD